MIVLVPINLFVIVAARDPFWTKLLYKLSEKTQILFLQSMN